MKNRYIYIYILLIAITIFSSCQQPSSSSTPASSTTETYEYTLTQNPLVLQSKRIFVYNKDHPEYIDEIINYGDSVYSKKSIEKYDYGTNGASPFNFTEKTGTYTAKVTNVETSTETVLEESTTTIEKDDTVSPTKYKSTTEYYKYTNGVKDEKAYLVNYIEALDKELALQTYNVSYSPKEADKLYDITVKMFDSANNNRIQAEVTFYTEGATGSTNYAGNYSSLKFKTFNMYTYNDDSTVKMEFKFLFAEDASTTKYVDLSVGCYNYNEYRYDKKYHIKEIYSAHIKNGYTIFEDPNPMSKVNTLNFEELPSQYECITYGEYDISGNNVKLYPTSVVVNNDQWDVESKVLYSYALMPEKTDEYYPCLEETWVKKGGQDINTTILVKIMQTKKTYTYTKKKNEAVGVYKLQECIYADKSKFNVN